MSAAKKCLFLHAKNRLGELLRRPGGIGKEEAVAVALQNVDELRDDYVKTIPAEMDVMDAIIANAGTKKISASDIQKLLQRAECLLVLSGTFGYPILDAVLKSFCDLCAGMIENDIGSIEPLKVHLGAMRLVSPDAPALGDDEKYTCISNWLDPAANR
jgi:hypothetical protein